MKYKLLLLAMLAFAGTASAQTGTALNFDGVNDYMPINIDRRPDYTVEARIMFTGTTTANQSIIVYTNGDPMNTYSNQIRTDAAGHFVNYTFDGALKTVVGTTVAQPNVWYHVSITGKTGDYFHLYVNGVEEGTAVPANNIWQLGNSYFLGSQTGGGYGYFKGNVDEVRIWSCALTPSQVASGVGCSVGGPQPSLLRLYQFNQGTPGGNNTGIGNVTESSIYNSPTLYYGFDLTGASSNWVAPAGALSTTCTASPLPEAEIRGNGHLISSDQNYTEISSNTRFGNVLAGATNTYKIFNLGNVPLNITSVGISNTDFTVVTQPAPTLAPGDSTSFSIQFNSIVAGYHTAVVHVNNSDCDESDYNFYVDAMAANGGALSFDGNDDYVSIPGNLTDSSKAFSFESWVYWQGGSSEQRLFDLKNTAGQELYLALNNTANGKLRLGVVNATEQVLDGPLMPVNSWHHLAVTVSESGRWAMYLDGTEAAAANGYTNIVPPAASINFLGRAQLAGGYFSGAMDEARFWNRTICPTELNHNRDCELFNPYLLQPSLAAYYSFNQGAANGANGANLTLLDGTRHMNNGTLMNFLMTGYTSNWTDGHITNGTSCGYYMPGAPGDSAETVRLFVNGSTVYFNGCGGMGQLSPNGTNPVAGDVDMRMRVSSTVPTYNGHAYVQRMYDVTPVSNPATATGLVTLFYTQADFDNYNAANGTDPDLPTGASDAAGISHIKVTQYHGTGTAPGNYSGGTVSITPTYVNWDSYRWVVAFPVTGFSGFTVSGNVTTPLPVKLVSYTARLEGSSTVRLDWNVGEQQAMKTYAVERSHDGQSFLELNRQDAIADRHSYYALDKDAAPGTNYYRLRFDEVGGAVTYSNTLSMHIAQSGVAFTVTPVPSNESITFRYQDNDLRGSIAQLQDLQGRIIRTLSLTGTTQTISLEGVQAGVYFLRLADGRSFRIIKN